MWQSIKFEFHSLEFSFAKPRKRNAGHHLFLFFWWRIHPQTSTNRMTWLQTVSLFLSDFLWGKGGTRTGKKGNSARRERKFHQKIYPTCPQLLQVACSFRVLSIKHVSLVSEDLVEKYFFFWIFFLSSTNIRFEVFKREKTGLFYC